MSRVATVYRPLPDPGLKYHRERVNVLQKECGTKVVLTRWQDLL